MKNLKNYIIFHDQESFDIFMNQNNNLKLSEFNYIAVGNINSLSFNHKVINPYDNLYLANKYDLNIEQYPSLLTFTAWYLLSKNDICTTDFIGLFEYDVKFLQKEIAIELNENIIYGFIKRPLPDYMFIDCLPEIRNLILKYDNIDINTLQKEMSYWNATSNFIVSKKFLNEFVDWYMRFVPEILNIKNHSHFHERMINLFAFIKGYENISLPLIQHLELNSHGIRL